MPTSRKKFHDGKWLAARIADTQMSQRAFASQHDIDLKTIQRMVKKQRFTSYLHTVAKIAKALGMRHEEFETARWMAEMEFSLKQNPKYKSLADEIAEGSPVSEDASDATEMAFENVVLRRIPFFDVKIPAGGWSDSCEGRQVNEADGWIEVPADAPPDAFAFRIRGDCMEPRFPDGAIIVCVPVRPGDNGEQFQPGKPHYFEHSDGKCTFKNVFYEPPKQQYRLESINNKYKPLFVPEQLLARMSRAIKIVIEL